MAPTGAATSGRKILLETAPIDAASSSLCYVDDAVGTADQRKRAKQQNEEQRMATTKKAIAVAKPLLEKYKAELAARGIQSKLSGHELHLEFDLLYADGDGHYGLEISRGAISKRFSDKGKNYTAGGGGPAIGDGLNLDSFETFVQTIIREFIGYSSQHGGLG